MRNPPAFPRAAFTPSRGSELEYSQHNELTDAGEVGMTLRDYFASSALLGLLSSDGPADFPTRDTTDGESRTFDRRLAAVRYAETAYILADAMLAARATQS